MFNTKKKTNVSVELNDYVLRALVQNGPNAEQWQVHEIPLPAGVVKEAVIVDEMALYELMKEHAGLLGGKKQRVRLFVPDTSVLLKSFEHPEDIKEAKLLEYVQMQLGQSIHLPFQDPLIDVYDHNINDGKAIIFAAPSEEVVKLAGIFQDVHMVPEAADIQALCNLRLLNELKVLEIEKTYLIADWSINELSIAIYSNGQVEFLRYQTIHTDLSLWKPKEMDGEVTFQYTGNMDDYRANVSDQVLELDRMMNFFKFSLHKGEKSVEEVVIMGDNPFLQHIAQFLANNLSIPLIVIDDEVIQSVYPTLKAKHAALIGLALKEVR